MHGRPLPLDPAHEDHDPLLIAQFAARDPLRPDQVAEANRLVSTCRECASLAADLGAIAHAVATEPVPPRRRDFRIDAEVAGALRGNVVQRFLRRVSRPETARLRPLAAGVMSIGLVMVVAGTIIPDAEQGLVGEQTRIEADGFIMPALDQDVSVVPGASHSLPTFAESFAPADGAAGSGAQAGSDRPEVDAAGPEAQVGSVDAMDAPPAPVEERSDGRLESSIADERNAKKARLAEPEGLATFGQSDDEPDAAADVGAARASRDRAGASELSGFADDVTGASQTETEAADAVGNEPLVEFAVEAPDGVRNEAADDVSGEAFGDAPTSEVNAPAIVAASPAPAATSPTLDTLTLRIDARVRPNEEAVGGTYREIAPTEVARTADATAAGGDIVELLIPLGIILALGGFALLALVWFARRAEPDPLTG